MGDQVRARLACVHADRVHRNSSSARSQSWPVIHESAYVQLLPPGKRDLMRSFWRMRNCCVRWNCTLVSAKFS
eukprot:2531433-Rhodomonas_salina.1